MFKVSELPLVRQQLAEHGARVEREGADPTALVEHDIVPAAVQVQTDVPANSQPVQAYPAKSLVLDGGRYRVADIEN